MYHHTPVLLSEVIAAFALYENGTFIDATLGGGGHTFAILERVRGCRVFGIDADETALAHVRTRAREKGIGSDRLTLVQGNFRDIESIAHGNGIEHGDGILMDLGFSSGAMMDPERGFSFQKDGPLDMRFDRAQELTAAMIINTWSRRRLADLFAQFGEERNAGRIADAVIAERSVQPIERTGQLVNIIKQVIPHRGRIHQATRPFQALRIAVNDELGALAQALPQAVALLAPGGRCAVISFHSLEERIVQGFFHDEATAGRGSVLTPEPIRTSAKEMERNSRSRSAKLQLFEKQK